MTWEIVLGISVLAGLAGSLAKWIVPLTESIVRLTEKVQMLCDKFSDFDEKSEKEHKKLWEYNDDQDKRLEDHARRLHDLDGKWE